MLHQGPIPVRPFLVAACGLLGLLGAVDRLSADPLRSREMPPKLQAPAVVQGQDLLTKSLLLDRKSLGKITNLRDPQDQKKLSRVLRQLGEPTAPCSPDGALAL